jgi:hypothetical protein
VIWVVTEPGNPPASRLGARLINWYLGADEKAGSAEVRLIHSSNEHCDPMGITMQRFFKHLLGRANKVVLFWRRPCGTGANGFATAAGKTRFLTLGWHKEVHRLFSAHRGQEIDAKSVEAHAQTIFDEAENRLHAQKAILARAGDEFVAGLLPPR